jgi:hypothetical protein
MTLDRQLVEYSRGILDGVTPVALDEILVERTGSETEVVRPLSPRHVTRVRSGWVVAVAAAAITILLAGVAWFLGSFGDDTTGVVEPSPSTSPTTTLPVIVEEAPSIVDTPLGVMEWHPVDNPEIRMSAVPGPSFVAWKGEILGVGQVRDINAPYVAWPAYESVLTSIDGATWRPMGTLPETPRHLAVYRDELLLVSYPSVWASSDLIEWRHIEVEPVGHETPWVAGVVASDHGVVLFQDDPGTIWALNGDRFEIIADPDLRIEAPADLAEAFPDAEYSGIIHSIGPIWAVEGGFAARLSGWREPGRQVFSPNGLDWQPVNSGDAEHVSLIAVGGGPGEYLGVVENRETLLRSNDGLVWTEFEDLPIDCWGPEIYAFDSGWLAVGIPGWGIPPTACISANGVNWDRLPEQLTRSWLSVSVVGDTVLIVEDSVGDIDSSPWSIRVGRLTG